MKKNCLYCGKEFEAKRKTAKYCSEICKLKFNRGEKQELTNEQERTDNPVADALPPKKDWFNAWVPYEPILDEYQPENGDVMCKGELLKAAYPKGKGTELLARKYLWHIDYHQKNCDPVVEHREAIEK